MVLICLSLCSILFFYLTFKGEKNPDKTVSYKAENELVKRNELLSSFANNLILKTPDEVLNRAFAKILADESIFQTKESPMYGSGGLSFYAAIWANDQAEYINPFFPIWVMIME